MKKTVTKTSMHNWLFAFFALSRHFTDFFLTEVTFLGLSNRVLYFRSLQY